MFTESARTLMRITTACAITEFDGWPLRRRAPVGRLQVVLDEVFGSQDEERRARLLGELSSLGNRFHQVLVITHVPDVADLCEHQLEVRLVEPGRSWAEFSG